MDKLEIGARIRITRIPDSYWPYFSVGDEGVIHHYDHEGDMWVEFDRKYKDGVWCVWQAEDCEFEVVDTGGLTHAEYFLKYGMLTEERIRDLLAVYENALIGYEEADSPAAPELIARVRKIDEAAALYLEEHGEGATAVMDAFVWEETPQGVGYWYAISQQLGEG